MKSSKDPRHLRRIKTIKLLFQWGYHKKQKINDELALKVIDKAKILDKIIGQSAPEWPINQVNRIDLAILRLAVFELYIAKIDPPKVIVDEAVEIAKVFGSEKSPQFINGVLGAILKKDDK